MPTPTPPTPLWQNPWKWRFSLTEAGLAQGGLANYHLPIPTVPHLRKHSVQVPQDEGGQALHGWPNVSLLWERLSEEQFARLLRLVKDAREGTGFLYATVWTGAYWDGDLRWIDVYGRPHWPESGAPRAVGGTYLGQPSHEAVTLFINALTVVNDPSSYS